MFGVMEEVILVLNNNIGFYKNDKKNGFGKYRWSDGREYIGFWENGKQSGYGKYTIGDQSQLGKWVKGKRVCWLSPVEIEELKKDSRYNIILNYEEECI